MNIITTDGVPRIPFKFRSETLYDCNIVRAILEPWIVNWTDRPNYLDLPEGLREVPDRIVEMELRVDKFTQNLDHVRWVLDQFDDLHVIVQSIQYAELYTGERVWEPDYGRISEETVPDNETMTKIMLSIRPLTTFYHDISHALVQAGEKMDKAWRHLGRRPSLFHD